MKIILPNPPHVLMPSMIELADAEVRDVGRWSPKLCPVCRGAGKYIGYPYRVSFPTSELGEFECSCEEQLVLSRWFQVRGISRGAMQLRWVDMTGVKDEWLAPVQSFVNNPTGNLATGQGVVFSGRSGSGKSSLAALLIKGVLWQGFSAYSIHAARAVDTLYKWRDDQEFLDRWNRRVMGVDLLVIDDLGKEHGGNSEVVKMSMERIITMRADDQKSTVITTNFDKDKMEVGYKEAIDVMSGGGGYIFMSLPESWRETDLKKRNAFEIANNVTRPAVWG